MANPLHVCVLYNAPRLPDGHPEAASETGVLESVAALKHSLTATGHQVSELAVSDSATSLITQLDAARPDVVVNLCESFAGNSSGEAHVVGLLELLGIPYTGSPPQCLSLTRNKPQLKRVLLGAGVPTPQFVEIARNRSSSESLLRDWLTQGPLFIKPAHEDASLGVGQESVVRDWVELQRQVTRIQQNYGVVLIERYIAGREFNVGILELPNLQVLPLAEIEFETSSDSRWPIVSYSAKWDSGSVADRATPVRCPANIDTKLAEQIVAAATAGYRLAGCRDYARIDLRVDPQANPLVLEVNANPDLGQQAGLARMLRAANISYESFAARLIETASQRRKHVSQPSCSQPLRYSAKPNSVVVQQLAPTDRHSLLEITRLCGAFRPDEIAVADELLQAAERDGPAGHYQVLVAWRKDKIVGWTCHGRVPMTDAAFDLYWIVVAREAQGQGVGRQLIAAVEAHARAAAGRWLLAETSSTTGYDSTRAFYRCCGYQVLSEIADFYRPGDGKITFGKRLDGSAATSST